MLAKENEYMQEASKSLYVANAGAIICEQCRAREDAERRECTAQRKNRMLRQQNSEQAAQLREKDSNTALVLFQNRVDYDIVRASIPLLSDEEIQKIYQKALKA